MDVVYTILGCAALTAVLAFWQERRARRRKVRDIVYRNLDAALEGGQFEPDGYLHGISAAMIANDLTLYAEDCSGYLESEVEPHVRAWMKARMLDGML